MAPAAVAPGGPPAVPAGCGNRPDLATAKKDFFFCLPGSDPEAPVGLVLWPPTSLLAGLMDMAEFLPPPALLPTPPLLLPFPPHREELSEST